MADEIAKEPTTTEEETVAEEETSTPETEEESKPEEEEIKSNEIEEVKSERGKARVQELANKASQLEKEKEELEGKLAEFEPLLPKIQKADPLKEIEDFSPKLTGDYESDIKTVEERATRKAQEYLQREQGKRDALWQDVSACEDAYPELKKGSENFDEKLSNEVVAFYNDLQSVNPNIRLKPVVDRLMRLKGYTAQKIKSEAMQNLKQQENEQAITPSPNLTSERNPKDLTLKEIENMVGTVRDY
jgi:hypothetical protein